ncbi:MAG: M23 family metallopeptidase [Treponema sp.]|nr:M23 family metallopeptidase [Treponema sp.]
MPKWPREYNYPEEVITNNEVYGTGRYPVSQSNHWHSGIHINYLYGASTESCKVYPFLNGELVAYRISKNYKTVDRPSPVSHSTHEKLSGWEKELYEPDDSGYKLKSDLSEEDKKEKYSNFFILLRHSFKAKKRGNATEDEIKFFTLYTNIIPIPDQTQNYGLLNRIPKEIPFYCEYRFKVNTNTDISYKYIEKEGVKLFPKSQCTFRVKDYDTYLCNFDNFNDETVWVDINKRYITSFPLRQEPYIPIEAGVPIYKPNNLNVPLTATLKSTAQFTAYVDPYSTSEETPVGGFYSVYVDRREVDDNEGVIKADNTQVLVRQTDLKGRGYLINNDSFFTDNDNNPGIIKGIMLCDKKDGNVRDILEEEHEFELAKPEELLNSPNASPRYFQLKSEPSNNTPQYILYEQHGRNPILAKVDWKNSYAFDEVVIPSNPLEKIVEDMLLGYADMPPSYNNAYYDAVLFFNDINFMKEQYEQVERHFIFDRILYKRIVHNSNRTENDDLLFTEVQFYGPHILKATGNKLRARNNLVYVEFLYRSEKYYLTEATANQYKVNMLEWGKFFRILGKEARDINEVIDGLQFIKDNYDWGADNRNVGAMMRDSTLNWWDERTETVNIKSIKRSTVCGHPLEWDNEIYLENDSVRLEIKIDYGTGFSLDELKYFKDKVEAVDIWGGLKDKRIEGLNTAENNFWFAHPVYFIKHIDSADLLDRTFNPYLGTHDQKQPYFSFTFICEDNPGFAPYIGKNSGATNYDGYAFLTNTFNTAHNGIDFYAPWLGKVPIHSFIYGQIVHHGNQGDKDFGVYLIIRSMANKNHFYLLGHLHEDLPLPDGSYITPGETVAYASNTGNCWTGGHPVDQQERIDGKGTHLHLQLIIAEKIGDIISNGNPYNIRDRTYNPFIHRIKHSL